jgi:hypothetical protein
MVIWPEMVAGQIDQTKHHPTHRLIAAVGKSEQVRIAREN